MFRFIKKLILSPFKLKDEVQDKVILSKIKVVKRVTLYWDELDGVDSYNVNLNGQFQGQTFDGQFRTSKLNPGNYIVEIHPVFKGRVNDDNRNTVLVAKFKIV